MRSSNYSGCQRVMLYLRRPSLLVLVFLVAGMGLSPSVAQAVSLPLDDRSRPSTDSSATDDAWVWSFIGPWYASRPVAGQENWLGVDAFAGADARCGAIVSDSIEGAVSSPGRFWQGRLIPVTAGDQAHPGSDTRAPSTPSQGSNAQPGSVPERHNVVPQVRCFFWTLSGSVRKIDYELDLLRPPRVS